MSDDQENETAPCFIQLCTAVAEAFGKGEDFASADNLYGLDQKGRVWRWNYADPSYEGSRDGWELLTNVLYKEGVAPPKKPKSR